MDRLSPEEIERIAHKRVRAKMGWYMHAAVYVLVNGLLFAASHFGLRAHAWSIYPAVGWGVGLALHGLSVFLLGTGGSLHEDMLRRERERLQRRQDRP
jgi:hypothetical protein